MKCLLHPFAQVIKQRLCSSLPDTQPQINGLAAHLILDSVESADPGQSLGCCGRCVNDMDLVKLASCMRPAGDFINGAIAVQMVETCVGVRLQAALEVLQ